MNLKETAMETVENEIQKEKKTEYQQAVGRYHTDSWSSTYIMEVMERERRGQKNI